jgi:hypothetical protein
MKTLNCRGVVNPGTGFAAFQMGADVTVPEDLFAVSGLTGPGVLNLPNSPVLGQVIRVVDADGSCNATNTITVSAGILGFGPVLSTPYAGITVMYYGIGAINWVVIGS